MRCPVSPQSPNISDQKLDAVATAIERVASLKQDYRQRIAGATPSDKERIAFEAINALANAVTDQGLSLERIRLHFEGGTERSRGSRKNWSAHSSFGQVSSSHSSAPPSGLGAPRRPPSRIRDPQRGDLHRLAVCADTQWRAP